jgi:hypothetical protein
VQGVVYVGAATKRKVCVAVAYSSKKELQYIKVNDEFFYRSHHYLFSDFLIFLNVCLELNDMDAFL